jgi:hypothetical protein
MSATSTLRQLRRLPRPALLAFTPLVLNTTLRPQRRLRRSPPPRRLSRRSRRPLTTSVINPRGSLSPLVRSPYPISRAQPLHRTPSETPLETLTISPSIVVPARPIRPVDPTSLALPLSARGHLRLVKLLCRPSCSLLSPPSNSGSSRMPILPTSRPSWTYSLHSISLSGAIFPPKSCRPSTSPFPMFAVKATSKALAVAPLGTPVAGTRVHRPRPIGRSSGATICSTIFGGILA